MSNKHIENLTVRLLQALDKNYDVVNMESVLSVIGALENATITKEQLEATRLAKYINLFRRRTRSEQLAKRAKSLLKKWREMVGMQQNVNEAPRNEIDQTRENPTQSTLPLSINTLECGPLRNNDTFYNNRIANTSNHYVEKKLEIHGSDRRVPDMSVSTAFGKTQPTSFANLLTGLSTVCSDKINTQNTLNGPNVRRKVRNSVRCSNISTLTDGISVDQTSNSNSTMHYPFSNQTKLSNISEPIIIDIEDSNSNSNIISNDLKSKEGDVISYDTSTGSKTNKHKKAKKEKKRTKERGTLNETAPPIVVIDPESSQSQQPQWRKLERNIEKSTAIVIGEKSQNSTKITNISEILSLSNSSMSSVFPSSSVGETKNAFIQFNNTPLSETELSFAGKFASQNTINPKISAITPSCANPTNLFDNNDGSVKTISAVPVKNKFHLFSESGHNSNDSASNSRHSNFEVVDSLSQVHLPQAQIPNTIEATLIPEQKVPKKRGRKKGSKGVDSLLAKDSLSSHMLIQTLSTGSKKVKTTKELYAEMQNRKLGVSTPTTPSHWPGAQNQSFVRRDSFCSEPSLHSPHTFDACSTNATVSTGATGSTPEKSALSRRTAEIDSESDSVISGGLSHGSVTPLSLIENDNKQECSSRLQLKSLSETKSKNKDETNVLIIAESKLRNIIQKMPAVPSKLNIEKEISNDIVPCTCKVVEILPEQKSLEADVSTMSNLLSLDALKSTNTLDESEKPIITISVAEGVTNSKINSVTISSKELNEICEQREKPKKSIFDLDFDEDEDPLNTLIAEVAAASDITKTERAEAGEEDQDVSDNIDQNIEEGPNQILKQSAADNNDYALVQPMNPATIYPTYSIDEDKNCLAKQRFELQTQKITNFHINSLHNYYIPNVNGNWDNSSFCKEKKEVIGKEEVVDCNNVVPKISDLWGTDEQITKNLTKIDFDRKFQPKNISKSLEQLYYEKPFLGVARVLNSVHRKTRRHRQNSKDNENMLEMLRDSVENSNTVGLILNKVEKKSTKNLIFNDIIINVDNDINTELKSDGVSDAQNILTIASNVNFNNNEIRDGTPFAAGEENINGEEESCNKFDDLGKVLDLKEDNDRVANCNNGGDIQNNYISNNCRSLDKFEESSCESHSSLKQTQKSINLKLRRHRRQLLEQEQNSPKSYSKRKRRRKDSQSRIDKKPKVKCIKIAINGGITTERLITLKNSSEDDEDEVKTNYSNASNADDTETSDNGTCFFGKSGGEESNEDGVWVREPISNVTTKQLHDDDYYGGEENDDDDDYEDEEDDEYFGEFHEVVARDISPSTETGNNHIVLTIKKTPSKTNSPSNSLSASLSPGILSNKKLSCKVTNIVKVDNNKEDKKQEIQVGEKIINYSEVGGGVVGVLENNPQYNEMPKKVSLACSFENLTNYNSLSKELNRKHFGKKRKVCKLPRFQFPDERLSKGERIFKKRHQQLFFPYEIFTKTDDGEKQRIFNISSCSSSCAENSDYEYESSNDYKKNIVEVETGELTKKHIRNESDNESETLSGCYSNGNLSDNLNDLSNKEDSLVSDIKKEVSFDDNELPDENNDCLSSFNNICISNKAINDNDKTAAITNESEFQHNKHTPTPNSGKCDNPKSDSRLNNHCNVIPKEIYFNSNLNLNETPAHNITLLRPEYCTGFRSAEKRMNKKDEDLSGQVEKFKEWHQILQVRSYNEELLTVLPYVVLD